MFINPNVSKTVIAGVIRPWFHEGSNIGSVLSTLFEIDDFQQDKADALYIASAVNKNWPSEELTEIISEFSKLVKSQPSKVVMDAVALLEADTN